MEQLRLLVTAERELRNSLAGTMFHREGWNILEAVDDEEAYRLIEEEVPDLAILCANERGFDAAACCRRVKGDPFLRSLPIILIVADEAAEQKARAVQANDVLRRPIDRHELVTTACRLLDIVGRASPRISLDTPCRVRLPNGDEFSGRIVDLNTGGIFLVTEEMHPVGTRLDLSFTLPTCEESIRCLGEISWVNHPEWLKAPHLPPGLGIKFLDLDAETAARVRFCFEENYPGPAEDLPPATK